MVIMLWTSLILLVGSFAGTGQELGTKSCHWRWVPIGGGGAIMTVEVNPHRPSILLAGCDVGGVLRSEDFGQSWRICNAGLRSDGDRAVADFAWDPENPSVVYMASGACFGQPKGPYGGLWRSTDSGRSWQLVTRKVKFSGFGTYRQWGNVLKIDPRDDSIWAGTAWDGLMKSKDGGKTWTNLGLGGKFVVGVEVSPADGTVYVGTMPTKFSTGGVWVWRDGGRSWSESLPGEKVRSIACDPIVPGRAYAVVRDKGLLLSRDWGKTWRVAVRGIEGYLRRQWANAVAVVPRPRGPIYLSASERFGALPEWWRWRHPGLFVSRDEARHWEPVIAGSLTGGRFDQAAYLSHVSVKGWWKSAGWFAFNPMGWAIDSKDPRRIYIHDFFGVWASKDAGRNWRAAMKGLATTCVGALVCSPQQRDLAYIGLLDVSFFRTVDGGKTIEHREFSYPASDCTNLCVAVVEERELIYSAIGRKVVLSKDRGKSWTVLWEAPEGARLGPAAVDSFRPQVIYCGRWRSRDGGRMWEEMDGLPDGWTGHVVPDPDKPGLLYAWNEYSVLKSQDGGTTWRNVSEGIPLVYKGKRRIRGMAVLPGSGRVFVASAAHGLYASDDEGRTWRCVLPQRYVSAVACGRDGRTVIVGAWTPWYAPHCDPGVLLSSDRGETWSRIDSELGVTPRPTVLAVDPLAEGRLWLGTAGNGVFVGQLAP